VLTVAAALVAGQVAFRAWALSGAWFYVDDFRLLEDASGAGLSFEYLLRPHDYQLMPIGRLVAWVVAASGPLDWTLAVVLTLTVQAAASAACVWMLTTLFGVRWGVIPPLVVYLTSVLTLPAAVWWAAALNQLPLQVVLFSAVALWVRYLRRPTRTGAAQVALVLVLGLLAYVKTLLVLPLLVALMVFWFTSGTLAERRRAVRRYAAGVGALLVVGGGYVAYYLRFVPQPLEGSSWGEAGELADALVLRAFGTGVVGGPWEWAVFDPPASLADPPAWSVPVAWTVIAAVVATSVLTRRHAWPAWVLLAGYLLGAWFLLITARGLAAGTLAGLEYRYLTDVGAVVCLALGLAFLPVPGAEISSTPRAAVPGAGLLGRAGLSRTTTAVVATLTLVAVAVGGVASSIGYARTWHSDHPAADWFRQADADLAAKNRAVPIVDEVVPEAVMPPWLYPANTTSRLLPLLERPVSFPRVATELYALDADGALWQALVDTLVQSEPGPVQGCGWLVDDGGATIPLEGRVYGLAWYVRVAYAASSATPAVITVGGTQVETSLRPGPQSLYLRTDEPFDAVRISGLAEGATACVDVIQVGHAVPGMVR
jgi:hypothetical protein